MAEPAKALEQRQAVEQFIENSMNKNVEQNGAVVQDRRDTIRRQSGVPANFKKSDSTPEAVEIMPVDSSSSALSESKVEEQCKCLEEILRLNAPFVTDIVAEWAQSTGADIGLYPEQLRSIAKRLEPSSSSISPSTIEQQSQCLKQIATENAPLFVQFATRWAQKKNLENIATLSRDLFIDFATDWAKSAQPEEARRFEISGRFGREAATENTPMRSIKITRGIYIEERWWEDKTSKTRPLGKIVPEEHKIILKEDVDLTTHYISPATMALLDGMSIEIKS